VNLPIKQQRKNRSSPANLSHHSHQHQHQNPHPHPPPPSSSLPHHASHKPNNTNSTTSQTTPGRSRGASKTRTGAGRAGFVSVPVHVRGCLRRRRTGVTAYSTQRGQAAPPTLRMRTAKKGLVGLMRGGACCGVYAPLGGGGTRLRGEGRVS